MAQLPAHNLYQSVIDASKARRQQADTRFAEQLARIEAKALRHTHGTQREQEHAQSREREARATS